MNLSFHVYGVKARVEPEAGGNETVAIRFQEYGTHHTFVARLRDPLRFIEMVAELQEIIKRKGWDVKPPKRRQDLHTDKSQGEAPAGEGLGTSPDAGGDSSSSGTD